MVVGWLSIGVGLRFDSHTLLQIVYGDFPGLTLWVWISLVLTGSVNESRPESCQDRRSRKTLVFDLEGKKREIMEKRVVVTMIMVVVLWVEGGWCWSAGSTTEDLMENTKERVNLAAEGARIKAEEMKHGAAETMQDAEEKGKSWTGWVYEKFTDGIGLDQENAREGAQNLMDRAGDAASKTTDTMNSVASETSKYASQKAVEAAEMAHEKAGDIKDFASEKASRAKQMASNIKASDAKERISGAMEYGKDNLEDAYDEVKEKWSIAKDKVLDGANNMGGTVDEALRNAKDKAANAFGDASQKMNVVTDEAYDAKEGMGEAVNYGRNRASDAYNKASNSASDWANDAKEAVSGAMEYGRDRASDAYDEARKYAKEDSKMASEKAGDAKDAISGAMWYGKEKASDAYDVAKENIHRTANIASEKANEAKEAAAGAMGSGREGERDGFDEAKNQIGEAYVSAKDTVTDQAKANYEAAKEKLSEATGDLGDKMRREVADL
ncbi:hypothetical protein OIU77_019266 [Salix suchowensis]|uniref:Uncharacterized protein n=1 Tax=Salix suchowensis TaxID=1278906 RepID=A0ABQ9CGD5_9ROSI|nr:hypothetical protein OIU77_019266 [Salix suchowensis]